MLVCLGNPPYGRHESAKKDGSNKETTGGWVRYGGKEEKPILEDFLKPAREAGYGVHLKNLYNQYVYFIRWAMWKVFEHKTAVGPGIVSFITASSYIDGEAFCGVREHLRRVCDRILMPDIFGGRRPRDEKGQECLRHSNTRGDFCCMEKNPKAPDTPAAVRYTKIEGTRDEKLEALGKVRSESGLKWETAPDGWQAPFRPANTGDFSEWPDITDMFPWQQSGVEVKRAWPIAPDYDTLILRWGASLHRKQKRGYLKKLATGK